jgi:hypothetical protein
MPLVGVVRRMWRDGAATDRQRAMLGLMCVSTQSSLHATGSRPFLTHFPLPHMTTALLCAMPRRVALMSCLSVPCSLLVLLLI